MSTALTSAEIEEMTSINVVSTLSEYDDCIVVGNKNLSDITEELQVFINKVSEAVSTCLSAEASVITTIQNERAELLRTTPSTTAAP